MQDEPNKRRTVATLVTLIVVAIIVAFWLEYFKNTDVAETKPSGSELSADVPKWRLSPLGPEPDWSQIDIYQQTITREMFLEDLTRYFTVSQE